MNKYLKFEYWNTCDLGNIYYQGGQKFMFYLDADVGEPLHEDIEEGQENGDGDFIPTYRRQMKRYRIRTGLIPDFLIDAMQRMKLHDNIELTFKTGEVEQIYNVDIEPEWQFEKYAWQGTVTMTFDMDESITVGSCCDNLVLDDIEPIPEYYWISPMGSDATGNGSYARPWATLAYACTQAVSAGDVIHVAAGTYNISTQVAVPVGVSIMGAGNTSILVLTWTTASSSQGCIQFSSYPTEGTNGNQSISHLYLDGDLTGTTGIVVYCRSNVIIHDITMVDFDQCGIHFRGNAGSVEATTKATGNQIYNCTINNCSTRGAVSNGLIRISSQSGMLIHDNILVQTGRAEGSNGNIVNAVGGGSETNSGFNDGVKYYRNKSYKPYSEGATWNFHIESWDATGWEVYDNDFNGGGCHIDIGGYYNTKGDYDYSFYIHGNRFIQNAVQPNNEHIQTMGIDIESNTSDVIITGNYFKNLQFGIYHSLNLSRAQNNIRVSYNVFESIGLTDNIWAGPIMIASEGTAPAFTNLYYDNNTMTASTAYNVGAGITFNLYAGTADARIRNNIIKGFMRPLWVAATQNPDTVYYQNNHSNNTSDAIYYSSGRAITELISADNQTGDPLFVGAADFHLQAGSPCINQGIDIGLTTDYDGRPVANPPEIGAYEY